MKIASVIILKMIKTLGQLLAWKFYQVRPNQDFSYLIPVTQGKLFFNKISAQENVIYGAFARLCAAAFILMLTFRSL